LPRAAVSFFAVQAVMPLLVYAAGTLLGTEILSRHVGCILFVVVTGVLIASYGEFNDLSVERRKPS
jgi:drug/metabolite transporter (DMT)-like permease